MGKQRVGQIRLACRHKNKAALLVAEHWCA